MSSDEMDAEVQLQEVQRLSADLEELRRVAVSPAVAAAVRAALVQLHLAAQSLGDDQIGAAFEFEPGPLPSEEGAHR